MSEESMNYEQSLEKLKALSEEIRRKDIGLEESLRCYEEGMACYEKCLAILKEAKAKIQIYEGGEV
ncbi:MAG: exodeoxyribonuclease VII small subunit [Eubacterium sp.]|nr:exodeoxyribonuclease VII small subunit [Eubacterium sp.]